jgi:hypothetical protein
MHTKGKWINVLGTIQSELKCKDGTKIFPTICVVCQCSSNADDNADLIAAAPALLEALKDLTALYAASEGADPHFVDKGLATIWKAERGDS